MKNYVRINPVTIESDHKVPHFEGTGMELLTSAYRNMDLDYPKFFKMDQMSRLGFLASEILLQDDEDRFSPREDRAILLFNSNASLANDLRYEKTITDPDNYYPSPAIFVYTLPNIVTGEIAIRNKYFGESMFYVMSEPDPLRISTVLEDAFQDRMTTSILCGWVEFKKENDFHVEMLLVAKEELSGMRETLNMIFKNF